MSRALIKIDKTEYPVHRIKGKLYMSYDGMKILVERARKAREKSLPSKQDELVEDLTKMDIEEDNKQRYKDWKDARN